MGGEEGRIEYRYRNGKDGRRKEHKNPDTLLLPESLVKVVEGSGLTDVYKQHCYKFYDIMLQKEEKVQKGKLDEISLPKNWFVKAFTKHYRKWLRVLIEGGIVDVKHRYEAVGNSLEELKRVETYYKGKGESKGKAKVYYLKFENISEQYVEIQTSRKKDNALTGKADGTRIQQLVIDNDNYAPHLIECLQGLAVNREKMRTVSKYLLATIRERLLVNDEITCDRVDVYIPHIKHQQFSINRKEYEKKFANISLVDALDEARMQLKHLIMDGNVCYIDKLPDYIHRKRVVSMNSYESAIRNLVENPYLTVADNGRVHTPISELNKHHLAVLMSDNGLTEIDAKNCQYALTAMWLDERGVSTPDAQEFKTHAADGTLYKYVMRRTGWTKEKAKAAMMFCWFSSHRANTAEKAEIRKIFPTVIAEIDKFKRSCLPRGEGDTKPYSQFAVEMQRRESNLMIQILMPELLHNGFLQESFLLTRHDSILIKDFQAQQRLEFVQQKAKQYGYNLKFSMDLSKYVEMRTTVFNFDFKRAKQEEEKKVAPPVVPAHTLATIEYIRVKYLMA
jgi:hypothetical protein